MKKNIITIILIAIMFSVFAGEYIHYGYSVKCAKCVEAVKAGDSTIQVQVAWRTNTPYKKKGDKVYAKYHCFGGHCYCAEIR